MQPRDGGMAMAPAEKPIGRTEAGLIKSLSYRSRKTFDRAQGERPIEMGLSGIRRRLMRAYELKGGFGIDSLVLAEKPIPQPGAGQVLVKMRAWSLNYRDLMVIKGSYRPNLPLPMTPLSDGVGEVVGVGQGVSRISVGQRVAGIFMPKWLEGELTEAKAKSALGGGETGMAAEYVVLDADGVVSVPDHLTDEEAATLPCAAVTAWHAVVTSGRVKAGDTVLTLGTGGVSLFALQFAKSFGARVIVTSSSDEKLARALDLGASDGINYKTTPEWGGACGNSPTGSASTMWSRSAVRARWNSR